VISSPDWRTPTEPRGDRREKDPVISTLVTTLLMAVLYLVVVRLVDMNEKEPLWAMLLFFALGAAVAIVFARLAPRGAPLGIAFEASAKELCRFVAIAAGVAALIALGNARGFHEFNGSMDGVVYGATAGLGFGTAERVAHEMLLGSLALPGGDASLFSGFGRAALLGLAHGVFGAIIGAGLGAAADASRSFLRAAYPVIGILGATAAHVAYLALAEGNSLSGTEGWLRAWAALLLPVLLIAFFAALALSRERGAIRSRLADEVSAGVVTHDELSLLENVVEREVTYLRLLVALRFAKLLGIKALHNRQVQLAFVKEQAAHEPDPSRRARLDGEIHKLRALITDMRRSFELPNGPPSEAR
jgi:protease PrsW